MSLRQPDNSKTIIILKNKSKLNEFPTIHKAAKWLKDYTGYPNLPFRQVYNGVHYGERWSINEDTYSFTSNESNHTTVLERRNSFNHSKEQIEPTGYWTFFLPANTSTNLKLRCGSKPDYFTIPTWQKDWFKKGQLGVILLANEKEKEEMTNENQKLKPGIYAIIEILGPPLISNSNRNTSIKGDDRQEQRYQVPIKYVRSLLETPIFLHELQLNQSQIDPYLMRKSEVPAMPLNPESFKLILQQAGGIKALALSIDFSDYEKTLSSLTDLENDYQHAVPEVKELISSSIEDGTIAQEIKRKSNFRCQLCEALELEPYSFKKSNGEYYVETHHIMPISNVREGTQVVNNIITVCANHHRQLHYGNVELIDNTNTQLIYEIDHTEVIIQKLTIS